VIGQNLTSGALRLRHRSELFIVIATHQNVIKGWRSLFRRINFYYDWN